MTDLGDIGTQGRLEAINEHGQVMGNRSATGAGDEQAFIWQDGVMTDLGTLGGTVSFARAINARGQVVGVSQLSSSVWHAFLWQDGVMTDVGTVGGNAFSGAWDINDRDQVVGESATASGQGHAFFWQDGVMTDLATLGGTGSMALDINKRGQPVGVSTTASGDQHAVLWIR
jgi:probable HAF family extracellular repeat protein